LPEEVCWTVWWPKPAVETLHSTFSCRLRSRLFSCWLSLSYLIFSFRVANFFFANSQNTQPHFITGITCKCIALCSFCKPTFSGATREWSALYNLNIETQQDPIFSFLIIFTISQFLSYKNFPDHPVPSNLFLPYNSAPELLFLQMD
jgi:hypothetical protein